jgi:hypothetical protein
MQPFPDPDPDPDTAVTRVTIDPKVMISMLDDHLVINAPTDLDLEMTEVLVAAAASAVATGSTVMIDVDPDTASDELIARRPLRKVTTTGTTDSGGPVSVLGAGRVQLATCDAYWTIHLSRGRLCRSDDAIDPHFVGPEDWTPIQALFVAPAHVTALTNDGTYLSTLAEWTIQHRPRHPAPV